MGKNNKMLSEDTEITIGQEIPLSKYRAFFEQSAAKEVAQGSDFQNWLNTQTGKSLKEAVDAYLNTPEHKKMAELLSERRFDMISEPDKAFIAGFDEKMGKLGYDFGGNIGSGACWGKYMVIYAKTGVKSKKVAARIYIKDDGIILRMFFDNIDKHSVYVQNAPEYIRNVFTGDYGNCSCNPKKENCRMRKTYFIDGKQIEKCSGVVFEFWNPTVEKLQDYVNLLSEFYPIKASRCAV